MTKQTPQVNSNDLNERVKSFNAKLIPLLAEFKLGLGATPFITPDGKTLAKPTVFDDVKPQTPAPENTPTDNSLAEAPKVEKEKSDLPSA